MTNNLILFGARAAAKKSKVWRSVQKSLPCFAFLPFFSYLCTMKRLLWLFILCFPLLIGARTLRPLVWVLDAGHGGKDVGTESKKHREKDISLEITKQVAALVRKNKPGIKLILTRERDRFVSLDERCQIANRANADLFLSIHVNSVERKPLLNGTETFFADTRFIKDAVLQSAQSRNIERSELLAWLLQKNYRDAGRQAGRGAKPERLYVLSHTMMPAALTEIGFLSNIDDEAYMTSKKGQAEIAQSIYNALAEYYQTTQAKTHKKTLARLRSSNGRTSGLKVEKPKVAPEPPKEEPNPKEVAPKPEENVLLAEAEKPKETVDVPLETIETPEESTAETSVEFVEEEVPAVKPDPTVPVFSIQVVAVSTEIRSDDDRLQGLFPVKFVKSGAMFKGLYGSTTDYKEAQKTLADIREKFPDAFIVAYLGDELITTARALEITR